MTFKDENVPIAYLNPNWRCCDVEVTPISLDPARGYLAWLEAAGRGQSGDPHYGLSRGFRSWASPAAVAHRVAPKPRHRRHLPFEPIAVALDASGIGQVPTTVGQVAELVRTRPSCFLSPEVAAGAAFDALLRGLLPAGGTQRAAALVALADPADPLVAIDPQEYVAVCYWDFDPRLADNPERLAGARCDYARLYLARSEVGFSVPGLVILPF